MITVYTCATGKRDSLRDDQCTDGALFVAYVDEHLESASWRLESAPRLFKSARRNARMVKILSDQFVDSEYSIWLDANVSLLVPAHVLIERYLVNGDLAVFKHRTRSCTYEEATVCGNRRLDDPTLIAKQMLRYRLNRLHPDLGLPETSVVIRRHTAQVAIFNNIWWSELCGYSVRDQLSFMYAAKSAGVNVHFISPTKYENPYFSIINRPAGVESTYMEE